MARHLRPRFPGACYHIFDRGIAGLGNIFQDDHDREVFLRILQRAVNRYAVRVHAFILMGSHYHLMITTPRGNVNRFEQLLNGGYAQWANHRQERTGHVFERRYGAKLVLNEAYRLLLTAYIHGNSVNGDRGNGLSFGQKWDRVLGHRWSSCQCYVGRAESACGIPVHPEIVWAELGARSPQEGRRMYRHYLRSRLGQGFAEDVMDCGGSPASWLTDDDGPRFSAMRTVPRSRERLLCRAEQLSADDLVELAARAAGVDGLLVRLRSRRGGEARDLVLYLCYETCGRSLAEIGAALGVSGPAVHQAAQRVRARVLVSASERDRVRSADLRLAREMGLPPAV